MMWVYLIISIQFFLRGRENVDACERLAALCYYTIATRPFISDLSRISADLSSLPLPLSLSHTFSLMNTVMFFISLLSNIHTIINPISLVLLGSILTRITVLCFAPHGLMSLSFIIVVVQELPASLVLGNNISFANLPCSYSAPFIINPTRFSETSHAHTPAHFPSLPSRTYLNGQTTNQTKKRTRSRPAALRLGLPQSGGYGSCINQPRCLVPVVQ